MSALSILTSDYSQPNLVLCGGLNKNAPHKLIGSDTISELVGVGVALLKEVCHWG